MRYEVLLTEGAERDLEGIHRYLCESDSSASADHVLDKLIALVESLEMAPARGVHPRELLELGIREYRQAFFKPYRVIYRVTGRKVFIFLIADGRRDFRTLLAQRLLSS